MTLRLSVIWNSRSEGVMPHEFVGGVVSTDPMVGDIVSTTPIVGAIVSMTAPTVGAIVSMTAPAVGTNVILTGGGDDGPSDATTLSNGVGLYVGRAGSMGMLPTK